MGNVVSIKAVSELQGTREWSDRLRLQIRELALQLESGYMDLARLLYQVSKSGANGRQPLYLLWGYISFAEYATNELNLTRKKAERLRRIWHCFEEVLADVPQETKNELAALGVSKMKLLTAVVDSTNVDAWLARAKTMTCIDLQNAVHTALERAQKEAAVEQMKARGETQDVSDVGLPFDNDEVQFNDHGSPEVEGADYSAKKNDNPVEVLPPSDVEEGLQYKHFALYPSQLLTVTEAMERAQELSGSDKKGHNLTMICTDFLAANDFYGKENGGESRSAMLAKMESLMGIRIVAVDAKSKELVYGAGTLETLAHLDKDPPPPRERTARSVFR